MCKTLQVNQFLTDLCDNGRRLLGVLEDRSGDVDAVVTQPADKVVKVKRGKAGQLDHLTKQSRVTQRPCNVRHALVQKTCLEK